MANAKADAERKALRRYQRELRSEGVEIVYENELMHLSIIDKIIHIILRTLNLNARAHQFYDRMNSVILRQVSIGMLIED